MRRNFDKFKRRRCKVTNKVIFSEKEAQRIIEESKASDDKKRLERRYYMCEHCDQYHMTKMTKASYESKAHRHKTLQKKKRFEPRYIMRWLDIIRKGREETI